MIKTILSTLILATISLTASAEYIIKMPLEVAQGGSLPNGTISFKAPVAPELNAWEVFADENGLTKTWNSINWNNQSLSNIPSEAYPLNSVSSISFSNNNITDISSLSNINSISSLNVSFNNLTNLNGLSGVSEIDNITANDNNISNLSGLLNITKITNGIDLSNNNLTNLDGLENLQTIRNVRLLGNNLENLNGISNLIVSTSIYIDPDYAGPKLSKNSNFCLNIKDHQFANVGVGSRRIDVCESPLNEWQQFAFDNGITTTWENSLTIGWANLNWYGKSLSSLPSSPYPLNDVVNINIKNNTLTNIDAFSNVKVSGKFSISSPYAGTKLAADTRFCIENGNSIFSGIGNATKSQLCETE